MMCPICGSDVVQQHPNDDEPMSVVTDGTDTFDDNVLLYECTVDPQHYFYMP